MLDLIGTSYVIDHVVSEHNARYRDDAFRLYASEVLRCIAEGWGAEIKIRYTDLIKQPENEEAEENGDEVALKIINRLGLKGKSNEHNGTSGEIVT